MVKSHGDLSKFTCLLTTLLCCALIPHSHPLFPSWLSSYLRGDIFWGRGRVARRPPASTVDGEVLSRLLTPTQASLARSKSAAALSPDGKDVPGNLHGDPDREEGWQKRDP